MANIYVLPPVARFPLGALYVTTAADRTIGPAEIARGLARHAQGDWGDLSDDLRNLNEDGLTYGGGLHSVYRDQNQVEYWVITEWDRSATTVLLPDDY